MLSSKNLMKSVSIATKSKHGYEQKIAKFQHKFYPHINNKLKMQSV